MEQLWEQNFVCSSNKLHIVIDIAAFVLSSEIGWECCLAVGGH